MRYLLKQKLFAFGEDFHILNENDEKVFFVDGRAFSLGNKLSFQDLSGNELVFIRQKLLSFGPSYELHRGGQHDDHAQDEAQRERDVAVQRPHRHL